MPLIPGLQVVRSAIDGYGVIAKRPFVADELIAEVDGVGWHASEDVDDRYSLKITDEILFDLVDQSASTWARSAPCSRRSDSPHRR